MEMINMIKLSIDFDNIKTIEYFHDEMKNLFEFSEFYERNIHALIDCFISLRYPEDGMIKIHIDKNSAILLEVSNVKYIQCESLF